MLGWVGHYLQWFACVLILLAVQLIACATSSVGTFLSLCHCLNLEWSVLTVAVLIWPFHLPMHQRRAASSDPLIVARSCANGRKFSEDFSSQNGNSSLWNWSMFERIGKFESSSTDVTSTEWPEWLSTSSTDENIEWFYGHASKELWGDCWWTSKSCEN